MMMIIIIIWTCFFVKFSELSTNDENDNDNNKNNNNIKMSQELVSDDKTTEI